MSSDARARFAGRSRSGSTWDWRRTGAQILAPDGYSCRMCGQIATEVDHILPVIDGGTDQPSNLRSLCGRCRATR